MAKHKIFDLTKNLPRDIYKRQVENVLEEAESIHAREGHMASLACTKRPSLLTKHTLSLAYYYYYYLDGLKILFLILFLIFGFRNNENF